MMNTKDYFSQIGLIPTKWILNYYEEVYIKECAFQYEHNLSLYSDTCIRYATISWLYPILSDDLLRCIMTILLILFQYIIIARRQPSLAGLWMRAAIIGGVLSTPALSLLTQTIILGICYAKTGGLSTLYAILLMIIQPQYLTILPTLLVGALFCKQWNSYEVLKTLCISFLLVVSVYLYAIYAENTSLVLYITHLPWMQWRVLWHSVDFQRVSYEPSYGIFWYFHALMLNSYHSYFTYLLLGMPCIASMLILSILSFRLSKPTTTTNLIAQETTIWPILVILSCLCVGYFAVEVRMMEILFAIALLCMDETLIRGMKLLRLITLGILLPLTVTPNMYFLWVKLGTGNANFLFFQGLCLWVFLTMFIIEYINSYLKRLDTQSGIVLSDESVRKEEGVKKEVAAVVIKKSAVS